MKNETTMMHEAVPAKNHETGKPAAFQCPGCMMCGATCSDCSSFDFTRDFCDYYRTNTTANTWACPAYYNR